MSNEKQQPPAISQDAVLVKSKIDFKDAQVVKGYDFNQGINYEELLDSYLLTGFQATHFGRAVKEVQKMLKWRLSDEPIPEDEVEPYNDVEYRKTVKCKIFLGYTSNMISSGLREVIRFLVQHKLVDVIVTTAGGIEEDLIKCLANTYIGDFNLSGKELRKNGVNRIGNLLVPNDNYCKFEDFIMPILDKMLEEQKTQNTLWTPSKFIHRMGLEINNPESVYYWCAKNNIPVYCPAITDGSIGDMIYFHSYRNPGLVLDIAADIRSINSQAVHAKKTGMIILGGGIVKHHICNANLMRNGADFSVYINTGQEFDGSDTGANPDEAVSWGKIKADTSAVKVYADATLVFPLLVAKTFAKEVHKK